MIVYIIGGKDSLNTRFIYDESIYNMRDDICSMGYKYWLGKMDDQDGKIALQNKLIEIINTDSYQLGCDQRKYLKSFLSFVHGALKIGGSLIWYREGRSQLTNLRLIKV